MAFRAAAWNVKRADKNAMAELADFIYKFGAIYWTENKWWEVKLSE